MKIVTSGESYFTQASKVTTKRIFGLQPSLSRKLSRTVLIGMVLLFAWVSTFAHGMLKFDHNEHMYITAGALVAQHKQLYSDFAYLQTPYLPLIYGLLFRLFNITAYYLLFGKLISFGLYLGACMLIFLIARWMTKRQTVALMVMALFALNTSIVSVSAESSNYIFPLPCTFLAFGMGCYALQRPRFQQLWWAGAGLLIAVAVGIKAYYVSAIVPFALVALLVPATSTLRQRLYDALLPFAGGIACGLAPLFYFLYVDFDRLLFNNLTYHRLNTQWRLLDGTGEAMTLLAKAQVANIELLRFDTGIILLCCLATLWWGGRLKFRGYAGLCPAKPLHSRLINPVLLLTILLIGVSLLTAFAPTPAFGQYFVMPLGFVFLFFIGQMGRFPPEWFWLQEQVLLLLLIATLLFVSPARLNALQQLGHLEEWSPISIHQRAVAIKAALEDAALADQGDINQGDIATLTPLLVVEANLPLYPEFATGPFLFRIGDLLTEEEQRHYISTSQDTLAKRFAQDPPRAIVAGLAGDSEDPLTEYAEANGFRKIESRDVEATIYLRTP